MHPQAAKHIAAGVLKISKEESNLDSETWNSEDLRDWKYLTQHDGPFLGDTVSKEQERCLRPDIQGRLLKASKLGSLARLFSSRWIQLEFRVVQDDNGVMRVYLLPDDVQRRLLDRSNPALQQTRLSVLRELDYSRASWNGLSSIIPMRQPLPYDDQMVDEDMSLLQLFNSIPSPKPDSTHILNAYAQDAMLDLLNSKISGLLSELYPYQRRSAALMLQKEVQPGQTLDPRLLHVRDQEGLTWYVDPVAGTVLLEPRHYDGISGGILAEEMGSGKTIICLALILATKNLPTPPPEIYGAGEVPVREKIASLAEMAASCATRNAVPWKAYFDMYKIKLGLDFSNCTEALKRNPGYYFLPAPEPRRSGRYPSYYTDLPKKIYLSCGSLVIVPNNLLAQWRQEIGKHTEGLFVLVLVKDDEIPSAQSLLQYDIIIISQSRFEKILKLEGGMDDCPFSQLHFKRCIVDEGHKLGNSRIGSRSNLLLGLNNLHFSSRWVVTGTPSHGLFGVEAQTPDTERIQRDDGEKYDTSSVNETSNEMEKKDLERIGSIAALYLKARPWANTTMDTGDTLADWSTYLMLPKHNAKSRGRWDCLKSTLNSLIVRHQLAEIGDLLPPVDEKVVVLDGSYQDRLSLNLFSMMIIFNSVQSQRTDMDYFFHPKQRKSLLQIVHNLKQTSFFGGSFFTSDEIAKSVQTAEQFLSEKKVPITPEDEALLQNAINLGRTAVDNRLRNLSNQFHEMPVLVEEFPGGAGRTWSLDDQTGTTICTSASMLLALQKLIYDHAGEPEGLNSLLNGGLIGEGQAQREKILLNQMNDQSSTPREKKSQTLAGNTKLGDDSPRKSRSHGVNGVKPKEDLPASTFSGPLELTKITSTVSAKLSYLLDSIISHQEDEKILVFYENDNVAWYLASMLDVLQIQHLIYAKGLTTERRAHYVNTFHHNPTFRVLLMDLSQAAFGLDIKAASRIYFINPVLNPQVEAQAIGRVRRINQNKPVSVETLVLRGSIDEVLLERKKHMTQAEHRQVKSILDIRPIYNWIKNASIVPMPETNDDNVSQMAALNSALRVFGRDFGRPSHPDEGLIFDEHPAPRTDGAPGFALLPKANGIKRVHGAGPGSDLTAVQGLATQTRDLASHPPRRIRFADS